MVKAIFTTKPDSIYDDLPEFRYNFPKTYLNYVEKTVGDFVIYYEPRRGGRQVYFSVAKVEGIDKSPVREDWFCCQISNYLEFDSRVPFREDGFYYESQLKKGDGSTNKGAFGRAIRLVPEDEFDLILKTGFSQNLLEVENEARQAPAGFDEAPALFERPIVETTLRRPFRDRAFTRQVREAYGNRCAITGLKIINGGGRPEVQAAHIRPVADHGPDSIRNGMALSGTVHWMFDRGLISIDENYKILKAKNKFPEEMNRMLHPDGGLILPEDQGMFPHQKFLEYHREHIFKG